MESLSVESLSLNDMESVSESESGIPNAKSSICRLEIPLLLLSKPKRTMKGAAVMGQTCSSPWAKGAFSSIVVKF